MILYACAANQTFLLDLVPSKSWSDFVNSFKKFVSRKGVPYNFISVGGNNFVSLVSQEFMNILGVIRS